MNMKLFTVAVVGFAAMVSLAESNDSLGRWTFSAGPAWRNQVKMKTKCSFVAPTPVEPSTTKRDMLNNSANWTDATLVDDPLAGQGGIPNDAKIWGVDDTRTEVYPDGYEVVEANGESEDHPMGINLQGGFDFYQSETLSVGLNLRFAGYWNMKSSTRGIYQSFTTTEVWTDHYIFPEMPPSEDFKPTKWDTIEQPNEPNDTTFVSKDTAVSGVGAVSSRFRGDLYQIGLGPKFAWTPFAGCEACSLDWLTIYGGVEALCNISHTKLNTTGAAGSSTDCLLGFGGNLGVLANFTENLGLYGQVGYEWIDKDDISVGGFKSEIDYSSLVISAGLQYRF